MPEDAPDLKTSHNDRWRTFKNTIQHLKDLIGGSFVPEQVPPPMETNLFQDPFGQKLLEQEGVVPIPDGSGIAIGAQFRWNERICAFSFSRTLFGSTRAQQFC